MLLFDDTIAAVATPLGEGGLAIIRLSGPTALAVADRSFSPAGQHARKPTEAASHTVHYGRVVRAGAVVDEVLAAVMRAPRTFTGEDTVEFTCHGGLLTAKLVLDTVLANGARLARPGEFTQRAFLNGRMDLSQAEAVADLIHSRTELALRAANEQLAGKLSQRINQLRDELMQAFAHIEAHLDFPEEDIEPDTMTQLLARLDRAVADMDRLLSTADEGRILRRGIRAAIIGRPNVGKSSLLNQLLGHDRAIVSPIPGTTRDTIEETANVRGLPVVFVDTAGLREGRDAIELEGIRRSRETLARAEFMLHVFDASEPLTPADESYLAEFAGKKRILVRNKIDLPVRLTLPRWACGSGRSSTDAAGVPVVPEPYGEDRNRGVAAAQQCAAASISEAWRRSAEPPLPCDERRGERAREGLVGKHEPAAVPVVDVSCLTGQGIEALKDAIKELVWSGQITAEMLEVMINSRHQDALQRAREATVRAKDALRDGLGLELVAVDLRMATDAVGEIVGKTATADLLDAIFSQFCIGK